MSEGPCQNFLAARKRGIPVAHVCEPWVVVKTDLSPKGGIRIESSAYVPIVRDKSHAYCMVY